MVGLSIVKMVVRGIVALEEYEGKEEYKKEFQTKNKGALEYVKMRV